MFCTFDGICKPYEGDDACKYCLDAAGGKACCCRGGEELFCSNDDICPDGYSQCTGTCDKEPDPCKTRPSECGPGIDACGLPFDCGPCTESEPLCDQKDLQSNFCTRVDGDPCEACCKDGGVCCVQPNGDAPFCLRDRGADMCPEGYEPKC